ncbi:MAG: hypothetical protein H6741_34120 [Alphaproteobacteria bacterium]|nr:hypothetical protein [Alphaproteobacteria bacterium]
MSESSEMWAKVQVGRVVAVVGSVPAPPAGWRALRVHCGGPPRPLGPLLNAQAQVERLSGLRSPILDLAANRVRTGLRRRLLSEGPGFEDGGVIVAELNRFAELGPGRGALVLEGFESVDAATLALVRRIMDQEGWLRLALVLSVREIPLVGPVAELMRRLQRADALLRLGDVAPSESAPCPPAALSPQAARAARAGAVVGEAFEAGLLAQLLDVDELRVLEALQEAHDAGLALEDLGDGCFRLSPEQVEALRGQLLPSLARAWNRRIAELLTAPEEADSLDAVELTEKRSPVIERSSERVRQAPGGPVRVEVSEAWSSPAPATDTSPAEEAPAEEAPAEEAPAEQAPAEQAPVEQAPVEEAPFMEATPPVMEEAPPLAEPASSVEDPPDPARSAEGLAVESWTEPAPAPSTDDVEIPLAVEGWTSTPTQAPPAPEPHRGPLAVEGWTEAPAFGPESRAERRRPREAQEARAAGHFAEAGELEEAVERYLAASREAPLYALPQSLAWLSTADALLNSLPETPRRLSLRARVEMERGRLSWLGAGQGPDLHLDGALRSLERAGALLERAGGEPRLRTTLRTLIAQVCYDRGDAASLERALSELSEAARELQAQGDARAAARLLNDQAAVWVRVGDVVRAAHLLRESRRLFSQLPDPSEEDRAELAETDHLLARLPLHVASRPGMEADALRQALTHATQAEALYAELGWGRDRARTWETMGRLLARLGEAEQARGVLLQAVEVQQASGDALGLATTASTLAQLMADAGQVAQAVELLAASVQLNQRMHSVRGLRQNRETLERLVAAGDPGVARAVEVLARHLAAAERSLGVA